MPFAATIFARRMSSLKNELPPSMIVSPDSSILPSSSTVASEGPPAGTMTQMCRAFGRELLHRIRTAIVRDDRVAVLHEPPRHVGAHPAESDHSELHVAPIFSRAAPSQRQRYCLARGQTRTEETRAAPIRR